MKKIEKILWGIFLIILGIILGLNSLEITNINIFFDGWWTLIIIIPCFIGLFGNTNKTTNIIGLIIGILLLLSCQNILDFTIIWKLIIPVLLITLGISLIFKDTLKKQNTEIEIKNDTKNNTTLEFCTTFDSKSFIFDNEDFKDSNLDVIFGEALYDLRKANFTSDTIINTSAVFGKIKIFLPNNVNVLITKKSILGILSNKAILTPNNESKTIFINDSSIFGGIELK